MSHCPGCPACRPPEPEGKECTNGTCQELVKRGLPPLEHNASHPKADEWEETTKLLAHLNERVYREFKKHGKTMDASTFAACIGAKMKDCVEEHIRQVAKQSYDQGLKDGKGK